MSLNLLSAYESSDDESVSDEETEKPAKSQENRKDDEDSPKGKNFFLDNTDSDDDGVEQDDSESQEGLSTANIEFALPSVNPYATEDVTGPLYGPPHPSQMYNYASYSESYAEASSSSGYGDYPEGSGTKRPYSDYDEHQDEPRPKRQRKVLTDEAAKKLIKRHEADAFGLEMPDNLEIIDANVDTQLGNYRENVIKNITTMPTKERAAAALAELTGGDPKKKDDKPTQLAKQKHQITYLAYLAKANEEKLKTEWAKNRLTKRQTQQKYGF